MRNYLAPVLACILLSSLLGYWATHELDWVKRQQQQAEKQNAQTMASFVGASLRTEMRRGGQLLRSRLELVFRDVLQKTPLVSIQLRGEGGESLLLVQQTPLPSNRRADASYALELSGGDDFPHASGSSGGRHGRGAQRSQDDSEWISLGQEGKIRLDLSLSTERLEQHSRQARQRVLLVWGAGEFAVLLFCILWFLGLRHQALSESLMLARAHGEHLEELAQIAAGLAHETRNPLGLVRGSAQQLLKTGQLSADERTVVETIVDQADVATSRLGDFIAYAKPVVPTQRFTPLPDVLGKVERLMNEEMRAAGIEMSLVSDRVEIQCDAPMLVQVLMNLILNASQAASRGVGIQVEFAVGAGGGRLSVVDNGPGIQPDRMPHIFSPYSSEREGGTGLGLAVVKRIVEAHGWRIAVESAPGVRTAFVIDGIVSRTPQP